MWEEKQLAARAPNRCLHQFCKNSTHGLKHLRNELVLRYPAGDPQLLMIPTGTSPEQALTSLGILATHTSLTEDQVPPPVWESLPLGTEAKEREKGELIHQ